MKKPAESYESSQGRADRIDTLLRYMVVREASLTKPGEDYAPKTLKQIAEFCGTDIMVIYRAEQSALRKFQSKIKDFDLYLGLDG
jgi:hypothetical protein